MRCFHMNTFQWLGNAKNRQRRAPRPARRDAEIAKLEADVRGKVVLRISMSWADAPSNHDTMYITFTDGSMLVVDCEGEPYLI